MSYALRCALGLLVALLATGPVRAQYPAAPDSIGGPLLAPAPSAEANRAEDPNRVPYTTEAKPGAPVLAFPATLWRGLADVIGTGVVWAEQEGYIDRFLGLAGPPEQRPPYGVLPFFTVGGRDGVVAGAFAFHNDLFGTNRHGSVSGRFGFANTYAFSARFRDPSLFGSGLRLRLGGDYEYDSEERFYQPGNDTGRDDRIPYERRRAEGRLALHLPLPAHLRLGGDLHLRYTDIRRDEAMSEPPPIPGFGEAALLSAGMQLALDLRRRGGLHVPRTYAGSVLLLDYRYGTDIAGRPLAYHRVGVEAQQYLPLPLLPPDRRLALRARLEKTHPPHEHDVPFYELAELGGPNTLRGYTSDRFRDEGYLLLQAEYRYPIWDFLDAVLFADAGQVFQRYRELDIDAFHGDVGFGVRAYGVEEAAGRLEFAFGPEGPQILLQVGVAF